MFFIFDFWGVGVFFVVSLKGSGLLVTQSKFGSESSNNGIYRVESSNGLKPYSVLSAYIVNFDPMILL